MQRPKTYQAYIPTHFREFVLHYNAKHRPNREAELEDAIVNCYYRRVDSLIAEGILGETTYHFNCRENDSSPFCHPVISRCKYSFIWDCTEISDYVPRDKILKRDAPTTGTLVLQMVGRYGNIKMLNRIRPSLISYMRDGQIHSVQSPEAGKFALGRDEIELFTSISGDCYVNNCYNIAYLNSVTGIREYTRSVLRQEEPFEADYLMMQPLYARHRLDLMEALDPYMQQEWSLDEAFKQGFIELLEVFYSHRPEQIISYLNIRFNVEVIFNGRNSEAKVRVLDWLKEKNIVVNSTWVLDASDVLILEWFLVNGYALTQENLASFAAATRCKYLSEDYRTWKANLMRVREFGILENALRVINKIEFDLAAERGYVCCDFETFHASERDRLAKIRVVTC